MKAIQATPVTSRAKLSVTRLTDSRTHPVAVCRIGSRVGCPQPLVDYMNGHTYIAP